MKKLLLDIQCVVGPGPTRWVLSNAIPCTKGVLSLSKEMTLAAVLQVNSL